jgi:hypothetical protein
LRKLFVTLGATRFFPTIFFSFFLITRVFLGADLATLIGLDAVFFKTLDTTFFAAFGALTIVLVFFSCFLVFTALTLGADFCGETCFVGGETCFLGGDVCFTTGFYFYSEGIDIFFTILSNFASSF